MTALDITTSDGWVSLDDDEYSSTVAFFTGGVKCVVPTGNAERGDEILIWQGVPELIEDGTGTPHEVTVFEGYDEVPDSAEYAIETLPENSETPTNTEFAENLDEAITLVEREMTRVIDNKS